MRTRKYTTGLWTIGWCSLVRCPFFCNVRLDLIKHLFSSHSAGLSSGKRILNHRCGSMFWSTWRSIGPSSDWIQCVWISCKCCLKCGQSVQEPVTVELGTTYQYERSGAKRLLIEKPNSFQCILLIDNLQWVLQNKDVYSEVSPYPLGNEIHIPLLWPMTLLCIGV